jgi:hypothetical protein
MGAALISHQDLIHNLKFSAVFPARTKEVGAGFYNVGELLNEVKKSGKKTQ